MSCVIVALDKPDLPSALALAEMLDPNLCRLKVGKELFTTCGVQAVEALHKLGFEIFLDLKFHDIPNTTAQAVLAAADMGVWMTNIHASVGIDTMRLCRERLDQGGYKTLLIAVTVLTSMSDNDLAMLGIQRTVSEQVRYLAGLTEQAGLDGVVCSANEAQFLKREFERLTLVTPGIRMPDDNQDDQKRICTPSQALVNGADFLVIGRSINSADNPNDKLQQILASIKEFDNKSLDSKSLDNKI